MRVLLIDQQLLIRDGVAAVLERAGMCDAGDAVVLIACDGAAGEQLAKTIRAMPDGTRTLLPERRRHLALTARETDILQCMTDGRTNKEIAAELHITEGTVKGHVNSILLKMNAKHRTHAVVLALSRGLVRIRPVHP